MSPDQPGSSLIWVHTVCNIGYLNILKAIKNATGTSVIFPIKISLIHFVFVLTSVPNVGERLPKLELNCSLLPKNLVKNDKFINFFGSHIKSLNVIQFQHASTAFYSNKQKNGLQHKIHFAGRTLNLRFKCHFS